MDPVDLDETAGGRASATIDAVAPDALTAPIDRFLPAMPGRGRAAGLVGPAVVVPAGAGPTAQLLAAMGRRP